MSQFVPAFSDSMGINTFKLYIAIDFGTDGLGIAYAIGDKVYVHNEWTSEKYANVVKPKTIILLDKDGEAEVFGLDAKDVYMKLGSKKSEWMLFERFKMSLYDEHIAKSNDNQKKIEIKQQLSAANGNTYSSEGVFIAAFKYIQTETKKFMRKRKIKAKKHEIGWIVTVPAIWSDKAKNNMKEWIIKSGLVTSKIPNQCRIVYEPDCASLAIQHQIGNQKFSTMDSGDTNEGKTDDDDDMNDGIKINGNFCKGEKYILVDAGGGTVDIVCHEIVGEFSVKEVLPPSGGPWGSCYIDDQYMIKLEEIFGKHTMDDFKTTYPNIYTQIIHNFQNAKATFFQKQSNNHNVRLPGDFIAFLDDKYEDDGLYADDIVADSSMGKENLVSLDDEYLKFDNIVWESMFDHVMDSIIKHVLELLNEAMLMRNCKYLCLVGGLSCSPYFQLKLKRIFGPISKYKLQLIIPQRPILSVVEGAAYFGITKNYIKSRKLRKTYGLMLNMREERALQVGVSRGYVLRNKYWCDYAEHYRVPGIFGIVAHKGQEISCNEVLKQYSESVNDTDDVTESVILCSDMIHPKVADDGEIIAKYALDTGLIGNRENKNDTVYIVDEFHFYETTIKILTYDEDNPEIKHEGIIKY